MAVLPTSGMISEAGGGNYIPSKYEDNFIRSTSKDYYKNGKISSRSKMNEDLKD